VANANSSVENETQDHCYSEDETAGHIPGEFEHKGEDVERTEKSSTATAGRHLTSAKGGLQVAAERKASNESARTEHQKAWDSNKKSVVPEQKKKGK
jgi:hypothetical protein